MKFPYLRYEVVRSSTTPEGVVYRPRIPLTLHGPTGSILVAGLVDTGADHVFISAEIADILGVDLEEKQAGKAEGVDGNLLTVRDGEIELELCQDGVSWRWSAKVGFLELSDEGPTAVYLGQLGFLEYFSASFDGD